jgi:exonuclease III
VQGAHGNCSSNGVPPSAPRGGTSSTITLPPDDGSQRIGDGQPQNIEGEPPPIANTPRHADLTQQDQRDPQIDPTINYTPHPATTRPPTKDFLKVASLNMRGRTSNLNGFRREKWFEIYGALNASRTAILAIQESHLTDELASNIASAYDTRLALHHSPLPDTRNAAGVAFVINKGILNAQSVTYEDIIPGRAILAKILWHADTEIKILNVYTPNDTANNSKFWDTLNEITSSNPNLKPDIMLGDFNLVEDSLDRLPCHPDDPNAVAALGILKSNLNLIGGWRRTHPDKREYSHQHAPNASQGRIDRIYVQNHLLGPAKEWAITPTNIETDHWMVSVNITIPEAPLIGKGRWQIPTYLFENDDIMKEINDAGKSVQYEIDYARYRRTDRNNPQTAFAKFKSDVVALCRAHAKVIHPTITNKIANTGGDGAFTQWVHCEFIVSSESIRPPQYPPGTMVSTFEKYPPIRPSNTHRAPW